jgi:hypothetical protein
MINLSRNQEVHGELDAIVRLRQSHRGGEDSHQTSLEKFRENRAVLLIVGTKNGHMTKLESKYERTNQLTALRALRILLVYLVLFSALDFASRNASRNQSLICFSSELT